MYKPFGNAKMCKECGEYQVMQEPDYSGEPIVRKNPIDGSTSYIIYPQEYHYSGLCYFCHMKLSRNQFIIDLRNRRDLASRTPNAD